MLITSKGWNNPDGDEHFKKQRAIADSGSEQVNEHFYRLMQDIVRHMHNATGALLFKTTGSDAPRVLDLGMAPGGYLTEILKRDPNTEVLAFTLPETEGGHRVLVPLSEKIEVHYLDITVLAADLGVPDIPTDHPDAEKFLQTRFLDVPAFDLVICDSMVRRTQERADYRESREPYRLTTAEVALGVEKIKPGGTLIILLHKVEAWDTAVLLQMFSKFSSVKLFKPFGAKRHARRSSFYMVATKIERHHPEAEAAIATWKKGWEIATFGTDEEYEKISNASAENAEAFIEDFGSQLVAMGQRVWQIQKDALKNASFIKNANNNGTAGATPYRPPRNFERGSWRRSTE